MYETRVDTRHRRKGLGKELVNKVAEELFKKKAKTIYAMVEQELLPFYKGACKFKKSGKWVEVSIKK